MNMSWFFSAGDASFYTQSQLQSLSWLPQLWNGWQGFGQSMLFRLWYDYPIQLVIKLLSSLGCSWWLIDKILWLGPLIAGVFGIKKLARYFSLSSFSSWIAALIYMTNTYILMLFSGGQYGVFAAYCFVPFVLLSLVHLVDTTKKNNNVTTGLWMSLLIALDLRLAYIVCLMGALYAVLKLLRHKEKISYGKDLIGSIFISGITVLCVHAFWILPSLLSGFNVSSLGEDITGSGMISFLSFADFSHALSLLHPNWPENLFGKVYFLQPEFLILPVIAFAGFVIKQKKEFLWNIVWFACMALFGAFLAKGSQAPAGFIYVWLFDHIPGFVMFRDPTKFYMCIALGYALLIPFTLESMARYGKKIKWIGYGVFLLFWIVTIRPLVTGNLSGNFKPQSVPFDYTLLNTTLENDIEPSRTLWIPKEERFGSASVIHPFMTVDMLFSDASPSALPTLIGTDEFKETISNAGVKYIIVPMDIYHTIFLSDYKYDNAARDVYIQTLHDAGFTKIDEFKTLGVFTNEYVAFGVDKPAIIEKQEQWAVRGIYVSITALVIAILYTLKRKRI